MAVLVPDAIGNRLSGTSSGADGASLKKVTTNEKGCLRHQNHLSTYCFDDNASLILSLCLYCFKDPTMATSIVLISHKFNEMSTWEKTNSDKLSSTVPPKCSLGILKLLSISSKCQF